MGSVAQWLEHPTSIRTHRLHFENTPHYMYKLWATISICLNAKTVTCNLLSKKLLCQELFTPLHLCKQLYTFLVSCRAYIRTYVPDDNVSISEEQVRRSYSKCIIQYKPKGFKRSISAQGLLGNGDLNSSIWGVPSKNNPRACKLVVRCSCNERKWLHQLIYTLFNSC